MKVPLVFTIIWKILKETVTKFQRENPFVYSAAIAFFAIFSLPGVLTTIVVGVGMALSEQAARGELQRQISHFIGEEAASQVQSIIEHEQFFESGTIATIISIGTILFSATVIFSIIQTALNAMWGVRLKPGFHPVRLVLNRLACLGLVIFLGLLLIVSALAETVLSSFRDILAEFLTDYTVYIMRVISEVVSLVLTATVFAMMFKYLPDVRIRWRDVWVGALVTALLFAIGRHLIGFYLSNVNVASTYGAAGSLALILVWIYYSSLILLFGAEFTQVFTVFQGRRIRAEDYAMKVRLEKVEQDD